MHCSRVTGLRTSHPPSLLASETHSYVTKSTDVLSTAPVGSNATFVAQLLRNVTEVLATILCTFLDEPNAVASRRRLVVSPNTM